jgi:cellulose synthase/poly-beta-1,6-N-acetylglucosamine synthase-like glycosyltransferase
MNTANTFTSIWLKQERIILASLTALWLMSMGFFWVWWFSPTHIGSLAGFTATTLVIGWAFLVPGYCFYFMFRMKKPLQGNRTVHGLRVAMVVTKAPSEPYAIVMRTLEKALAQNYPHDTWVADEDPTEDALRWYQQHGIHVSCRKYDSYYHNDIWPRRKKCKEGNLAYFYEKYGYEKYDIVIQMDADHAPEAKYLENILRPFSDPRVGYVAAPSICDTNRDRSWSARARMQSEATFHGPIQSGSNDGWVPICIGSHYAVRVQALKNIGGIGPELAEDYSTTLLFHSHGWKGVWVYDAEAHGEGPHSFHDIIVQDYQWARSLTILLCSLYIASVKKLNWKQRFQFTFTELWYPMNALLWLVSVSLPLVALGTGASPVQVDFTDFLFYASIPYITSLFISLFVLQKGHLRPEKVKWISWESALFELARWPWVLIACIDGIFSLIIKRHHTFHVTSKTKASTSLLPFRTLTPYFAIVAIAFVVIVFGNYNNDLVGYYWFMQAIAWSYIVLIASVIVLHIKELSPDDKRALIKSHLSHIALITTATIMLFFTLSQHINIRTLPDTTHTIITQR